MRGADNWNLIPQNIREMSQIGYFKKSVREWIVKNIPKFVELKCENSDILPKVFHKIRQV